MPDHFLHDPRWRRLAWPFTIGFLAALTVLTIVLTISLMVMALLVNRIFISDGSEGGRVPVTQGVTLPQPGALPTTTQAPGQQPAAAPAPAAAPTPTQQPPSEQPAGK